MTDGIDMAAEHLIECSCRVILERFRAHGSGFIDTKFDIVTGREFAGEDFAHRRDLVFGWIQGRALESLAKHCEYFSRLGREELRRECAAVLRELMHKLQTCRRANGGKVHFAMTPDGAPVGAAPAEVTTFADLFFFKGLWCAASLFHDAETAREAAAGLTRVFDDIEAGRFVSGQLCFDPKNPAATASAENLAEGPRMIALGAFSDLVRLSDDPEPHAARAERFLRFILEHHLLRGAEGRLCFFEYVRRADLAPATDHGVLLCDPGHGIEFTGLSARLLRMMKRRECRSAELESRCRETLPELFLALFGLGFQPQVGGIVKAVDALSGRVLNSDMPWWSLPESCRAARELAALFPERAGELARRGEAAWTALTKYYLQPNGFCCQTRDEHGRIAAVIPAVPDADPGYHTNLCLIPD